MRYCVKARAASSLCRRCVRTWLALAVVAPVVPRHAPADRDCRSTTEKRGRSMHGQQVPRWTRSSSRRVPQVIARHRARYSLSGGEFGLGAALINAIGLLVAHKRSPWLPDVGRRSRADGRCWPHVDARDSHPLLNDHASPAHVSRRRDARPQWLLVAVAVVLMLLTLLMPDGVLRYAVCAFIVAGYFVAAVRIARRQQPRDVVVERRDTPERPRPQRCRSSSARALASQRSGPAPFVSVTAHAACPARVPPSSQVLGEGQPSRCR